MPRVAGAACLALAMGAAPLLQGCGSAPTPVPTTPAPVPETPAPTTPAPEPLTLPFVLQCGGAPDADPDCTVNFYCNEADGEVYRTSSLDCTTPNHTTHSTYGETCADWLTEDPDFQRCSVVGACCAYSNTGMNPTSDSVCQEAMDCMQNPHPVPTPAPLELPFVLQCGGAPDADPDCTVNFYCDETDGQVYRTSNLDCKTPNHTTHSTYEETCADWLTEDHSVQRCSVVTACCAYSNTGMNPTSDSVCQEAMDCMQNPHPRMVAV